jgi:antitoxin component YwqK of YwqJK toxin-antitoxin module
MRYFLFSILLIVATNSFAQNLTYKDLTIILSRKDWDQVNDLLISKGWKFDNSTEEDADNYATISWSYGKSIYDEKAKGWVFLTCSNGKPIKVSYQFHVVSIYNQFKNSILSSGLKKYSSDVIEERIINRYSNANYLASLETAKSDADMYSSSALYLVRLQKASSVFENQISTPVGDLNTDDTESSTVSGERRINNEDGTYSICKYTNGKINGIVKTYNSSDELLMELNYKNNLAIGPYKIYEGNNVVETGNYVNDKRNGGYKRYENGKLSVVGTYKNDEADGVHTLYFYSDEEDMIPTKSIGYYKNDLKNGLWKTFVTLKSKDIMVGYFTYSKDELEGPAKIISTDSIIYCNYEHGQLNGEYRLYIDYISKENEVYVGDTSKAYLKEKGMYISDSKDGIWKTYTKNKALMEECNYNLGFKQGICKTFYSKQKIKVISSFDRDVLQSELFYNLDNDELYTGTIRIFWDNLLLKEEISVANGKRNGKTKTFTEEGILDLELDYIDGVVKQ